MDKSIIKKGKTVLVVSSSGEKINGTISSVGRKYFNVDCGENYRKFKFEIDTLEDSSGFCFNIYQSENFYNRYLNEQKQYRDINEKMIDTFKRRKNVSIGNMEKIIRLLSE